MECAIFEMFGLDLDRCLNDAAIIETKPVSGDAGGRISALFWIQLQIQRNEGCVLN